MSAFTIADVYALQIIDSRGDPTVEVVVVTEGGGVGRAATPAGASRGRYEAVELRDGGRSWGGRGVSRAVENVNKFIAPAIKGLESNMYRVVDRKLLELDGTPNKSRLGANALTAVSLANVKAAADTLGVPLFQFLGGFKARLLPIPLMNLINGGAHAGNELTFQEFMVVPVGADKFSEALRMAVEVYKELRKYLKEKYGPSAINVGDEGGYAPPMKFVREALDALVNSIRRAGYSEGTDIYLALDAAASQFYDEGKNVYRVDGKELSSEDLLEYYRELVDQYPVKIIEDPFNEEAFQEFTKLRSYVKGQVLIIGDDLTVTNINRIKKAVSTDSIDGSIIKVNQVGTISESEECIEYLLNSGKKAIISHRSGDTEDNVIAHIAVAYGVGLIKTGAPARGERTSKYNELLRIEYWLGDEALYAGKLKLL
ncbi:MAG: phosphopyruvate hydratase [Desulfurococcaceae archaeon]|nr:phosphopyruvate hydratase [Desulfurococcaceae archaeon]